MASKTCFVTVGATASFPELVKAALSSDFVDALGKQGYTELLVQYGQDGKELYETGLREGGAAANSSVKISGFDLDKAGLSRYMRQAKGSSGNEGLVVSHGGSGTILDALRLSVPIIVVPNASLLDNHQVELAEALAEQDYVVHGRLDAMPQALQAAEQLRTKQNSWPPPNSGQHRADRGLKGILDQEMSFLDGDIDALPAKGDVFKSADVSFVQTMIGE